MVFKTGRTIRPDHKAIKNYKKRTLEPDQKTSPKVRKRKITTHQIPFRRQPLPKTDTQPLSKLDNFFNIIKDGTWHILTQLSKKLELPTEQLTKISEILSEQGLIQYQEEAGCVKANPEWKPILSEEEEKEKLAHKPTTGTIIIPPEESVTIQNVRITNVTEKEVELWIKVCKKFTEIAISKIN